MISQSCEAEKPSDRKFAGLHWHSHGRVKTSYNTLAQSKNEYMTRALEPYKFPSTIYSSSSLGEAVVRALTKANVAINSGEIPKQTVAQCPRFVTSKGSVCVAIIENSDMQRTTSRMFLSP